MPAPARWIDVEVRPSVSPLRTFTTAGVVVSAVAAAVVVVSPLVWLAARVMEWAVAP